MRVNYFQDLSQFLTRTFLFVAWASLLLFCSACAPVRPPVPAGMIPQPKPLSVDDEQYGHQVLQELTNRYPLDYNHPRTQDVQDIVERLTKTVGADKDPWHVYVLKDATVKNAAATRGNHVFVWTGMLDSAPTNDELATVLSHEIAHILAGHTDPDPNEEIKQLLINIGAVAAGAAVSIATRSPTWSGDLGQLTSSATQQLANGLILYPYSRTREAEADQIGLFMMADAKYNPEAAIAFWSKVPHDPDYREGISFLSTHPPAEERLASLRQLLPQAIARYQGRAQRPPLWNPSMGGPQPGSSGTSSSLGGPGAQNGGTSTPSPGGTTVTIPLPGGSSSSGASGLAGKGPTSNLSQTGDSFSLDGGKNSRIGSQWIVKSSKAILYRQASSKSRKMGEFRSGARIFVIEDQGEWVAIQDPDSGRRAYLRRSDLDPAN